MDIVSTRIHLSISEPARVDSPIRRGERLKLYQGSQRMHRHHGIVDELTSGAVFSYLSTLFETLVKTMAMHLPSTG